MIDLDVPPCMKGEGIETVVATPPLSMHALIFVTVQFALLESQPYRETQRTHENVRWQ